ncbi:MAG: GNAT family protein [Sulfobacillus sp.]|nr:GNAT family protein [Sulfobacillus sp.]
MKWVHLMDHGPYRRLRRLEPGDVTRLMEWDNDPEIYQLTGKKFSYGLDPKRWWLSLHEDSRRLALGIVNDQQELVGDVELEHIAWRAREAELRISIGDKRYWNQGIGGEAVSEMLMIAFGPLGLERIYLRVRHDNPRAIRVYQKVGFQPVGRLKATGHLTGMADLILMEVTPKTYQPWKVRAASALWFRTPVS